MTIPASRIVRINPGVVNAGGAGLVFNCLFLTESLLMPTGNVLSFASVTAVQDFFGISSPEAAAAAIYFLGYQGASLNPSAMLFASYSAANRAAFLNSGSFRRRNARSASGNHSGNAHHQHQWNSAHISEHRSIRRYQLQRCGRNYPCGFHHSGFHGCMERNHKQVCLH
jgi:hypothetical protein